ncbi:2Fe-2S iron-sulfur cluster-binding protein [Corallococcus interemptor]|uniref:Ferredoxin n=1 Tax=Corallococcus interemptor TaxID=2316720 RepID=A0A3A8QSE9_9BACT|nr:MULTISPECIES: 2Fe-2S iron-sulfur cluster-binding protein [Corallococcus]MBZ4333255.1 2Fe-2S iron-sulfur cluster binding domain-containing protein [Corallococcus sp. AS-1-12]MBZ4373401.1 2Fe-2S iron-sulfur cluster binding domain-containing protein [Corallococcus sp. AS-1-6]RKH51295.1 ferredoxin [Corallococcus sp. AB050B]RKH69275.1 ferredoxin [Corallococcus interemptor]RKI72151.1 ferredoxin [Corallococcus sp. AB049A]
MPKVTFKSPLAEVAVDVPPGTTLLDAAEKGEAQVGHSCGGVCGCSTCHVWVRKGLESLSEQRDDEMDRLDMGFDVRPYSRLSCQTEVGGEDVTVEITEESLVAFMDENPAIRRKLESEGRWPLKK